jgi:hypothetical protein
VKADKLVIIHFSPVEWYPPVQNLVRMLETRNLSGQVILLSTKGNADLPEFKSDKRKIRIARFGKSGRSLPAVVRYWNYFQFFFMSTFFLVWHKPKKVLYFETISAFPAFAYKKWINPSVQLFIHYHEYTSPPEYSSGMMLVKYFHQLEKKIYRDAAWVSHTNAYRLSLFEMDIAPIHIESKFILSNYPPRSWENSPHPIHKPLRVVYVGALSLKTMYTRQFAEWVVAQGGLVSWDIYSYNYDEEVAKFFECLEATNITINPGIPYEALPSVVCQFDVGVILYNGHIPNYIYNAPNKLFEYLACGLDVWFPKLMEGSLDYVRTDAFPKVIALDFDSLNQMDTLQLVDRMSLTYRPINYFCENALDSLLQRLTKRDN